MSSESDIDFSKLKVAELKQELKKRGLSTEGKKNELVERLQTSIGDAALLDDTHDDLLDDAELSDEEEVLDDSAIDTPPPQSEPTKPSPRKRPVEDEEEKRHPKKIILNRKIVEAPDPEPEPAETAKSDEEEGEEPKVESAENSEPKKVLTEQERREKRMARFGAVTADTKSTATAKAAKIGTALIGGANIDLLKKRAARFGTIAPVLEKVKVEEKKEERLKRFGETQLDTAKVAIGAVGGVPAAGDQKAKRAARFAS